MQTILLIFLVIADFALLIYIYMISKRKSEAPEILRELAEERRIIEELRASLKDQNLASQKQIRDLTEKVTVLLTEAEVEYDKVKSLLDESSGDLVKEIESKLDQPIEFITKKCDLVQRTVDQLKKEKDSLLLALKKAETFSKFFDQNITYNDVIEEIQDKKYTDARYMLSKGIDSETIATQLNMDRSEVDLLVNLG